LGKQRAEIYSMMRWWLDKGIDGFRMDVINMLSSDGCPTPDLDAPGTPEAFHQRPAATIPGEMARGVPYDI
jgi:oligo-1,6-glucosidase